MKRCSKSAFRKQAHYVQHLIGGEWVEGPRVSRNINPSDTRDVIGEFAQAEAAQARQAIAAATQARSAWGLSTPPKWARCCWTTNAPTRSASPARWPPASASRRPVSRAWPSSPCRRCWNHWPRVRGTGSPAGPRGLAGLLLRAVVLLIRTGGCVPSCDDALRESSTVPVLTESASSFAGGVEAGNHLSGIVEDLA